MFLTCEVRTVEGESLGVLVLKEKTFRSGSTGYHGQGKLEIEDVRYQCQLVEIGSKAKANGS